jgi:D-threo-aldose 1-dehydrogenase
MPTQGMKITGDQFRQFGRTALRVPPIVFGTAGLGNAFEPVPDQRKTAIICEWFRNVAPPIFIDTAGKYGAGMALEVLGRTLEHLDVAPNEVIIINNLAGKRAHHARKDTSYDGIFECWEEGCSLLGGRYVPQLASVDDADEFLAAAASLAERDRRFDDLLGAYRALGELKDAGLLLGVGAAAIDWRMLQEIDRSIKLDWVMLANNFTVMNHPPELIDFIADLARREVAIINSGVFHAGFLVGGPRFNGRALSPDNGADARLFSWRKSFVALCEGNGVSPAHACVQFGMSAPGIVAAALDTTRPERVSENVELVLKKVPESFWSSMKEEGLLAEDYPYLG